MQDKTPKIIPVSKYARSQVYFYVLSMLTSLFNFLYYPVLARLVDVSTYGEVQFIATILFQISTLFLALNVVSIVLTITYASNDALLSKKLSAVSSLLNILTLCSTIILIVMLWLAHDQLQFSNPLAFAAMGIAIVSTVPFTLGVGVLQGKNSYVKAGSLNLTGAALKLLFASCLVIAGLGATGAILGIAIGQIVALLVFSSRDGLTIRDTVSLNWRSVSTLASDRPLLVSSFFIVLINALMGIDVVLSKLLLNPAEAGEYAGVATLAKIAIFVVSPLMWISIPYAVRRGGESAIKKLLLLAAALSTGLILLYLVFGEWVLSFTVGTQYLSMNSLLVIASVGSGAMAIAAMLNIILVARAQFRHAGLQAASMALTLTISFVLCSSLSISLLPAILISQIASGGAGIAYYSILVVNGRKKYSKNTN